MVDTHTMTVVEQPTHHEGWESILMHTLPETEWQSLFGCPLQLAMMNDESMNEKNE